MKDMTPQYPQRIDEIQPFKVMSLLARARELAQAGHEVIHMEVGEPDFDTPAPVIAAGIEALKEGKTKYTPANGLPELRQCISRYYETNYQTEVSADRIFITAGASGALLLAVAVLMNAGEGLLMTDPGYPCYRHFLKSFHGEGQLVPVSPETNYQLTPGLIDQYYRSNTKGALLASPANPTGSVISGPVMKEIASLLASKPGWMLVDEIYQGLIYGDASVPTAVNLGAHVFVVNSFSKYFGMTGWRLGWLVVPEAAISRVIKLAQNLFICASSIAQEAAVQGFTAAATEVMEKNKQEFQKRRDFLVPALRKLGFDIPLVPEGAFYVYAGLPEKCGTSDAFCERLLEEHYVSATPGTDFGTFAADSHVRFSYAQSLEKLEEGVNRISRALG